MKKKYREITEKKSKKLAFGSRHALERRLRIEPSCQLKYYQVFIMLSGKYKLIVSYNRSPSALVIATSASTIAHGHLRKIDLLSFLYSGT